MGIFSRLKMGLALTKDSFTVLRRDPELAVFPLVSGVFGLAFIALLFGGSYVTGMFDSQITGFAVLFAFYFGTTFIASFFNAGLVYSARESFAGREPSVRGGLAAAWEHKTPLFVWALAAATVGIILRAIESTDNPLAELATLLFSVAWSVITYFMVPVIVFEDVSPAGMFKRSGETFKNTWGETASASFGISIVTFLLMGVGVLLGAAVFVAFGGTAGFVGAVAVGAVVVLAVGLFGTALSAIAKTALYVYATEGKRPAEFENVDFERGAQ